MQYDLPPAVSIGGHPAGPAKLNFTYGVPGIPRPQGSKRHVGNGRLVEMSKGLPAWRKANVEAIELAMEERPWWQIEGPAFVKMDFWVPRPAAAKGRPWPHLNGPGDLDKLVRAVADAITKSGLWKDDSQMVELVASKRYDDHAGTGGVRVWVAEI